MGWAPVFEGVGKQCEAALNRAQQKTRTGRVFCLLCGGVNTTSKLNMVPETESNNRLQVTVLKGFALVDI